MPTDRPHPDLDAPLSEAEAEEMWRVTDTPVLEAAARLLHEVAIHVAEYGCDVSAPGLNRDIVIVAEYAIEADAEVRKLRAAQEAALAWARDRGYLDPDYADEDYPCDELWTAMIDALRALAGGPSSGEAR